MLLSSSATGFLTAKNKICVQFFLITSVGIFLIQTADGRIAALEKTSSKTKAKLMAGGDHRDMLLLPDGV